MRKILLASMFVFSLTLAAPAHARDWVQAGNRWIDHDSIRRADDIVVFEQTPLDPSTWNSAANDPAIVRLVYQCSTRFLAPIEYGRIQYDYGRVLDDAEAATYSALLCR